MTKEEILADARRQATEDFLKRTPDGQRMTNVAAGEPWKPTAFDMEAQQHQTTLAPGAEEAEDGGMGDSLTRMAKKGVLPAVGTTVGGFIGGIPGAMAGGALGETINQKYGIGEDAPMEDPDLLAIGMSGMAPGAGKAAYSGMKSAGRNALRGIPGSGAAIHEMAAETGAAIPGQIGPSRTIQGVMKLIESKNPGRDTSAVQQAIGAKLVGLADPNVKVSQLLYETADELAKQAGGPIKIESNHVKAAVAKLLDKEAKMGTKTASAEIKALAEEFDGLAKNGTGIPFDVLYARLQRLNGQVGGAKGEDIGAYKLMIGAIENDINHTVAGASDQIPAAQAFRTAQAVWKQEKGQAAVQDLITRATSNRGSDELVSFNRGMITKALDNDKNLQKLLGPKAVAFIRNELSDIGILPALPPPPGAHFGSGRNVIGAGAGLVAGLIGTKNTMAAAAISASVPVVMEIASKAAMTETGRAMIRHFAKAGKGKLGPAAVSILSAYVEGGTHILDGAAEMGMELIND